MIFKLPIRIYYEDTDAGGIVYHSKYLNFCERARTEYLRKLGIEQDTYLAHNIGFVVKSMAIDFKTAAKFNEMLVIESEITLVKKASVEFSQIIKNEAGQLVFTAKVQVACVDIQVMKPKAIPEQIVEVLNSAR